MPEEKVIASQVIIKIDGTPIEPGIINLVLEVVVEQSAHLPAAVRIRLLDPELSLIDSGPFDLTKEIEILAQTEDGSGVTLFKGEITAMEPRFLEGMMSEVVFRGYDKSHRLFRQVKSKAYLNIKDSDLASQIASGAGLSPQVDPTSIVYEHLYQHNQTDLEFLVQRAWRIGYECFVAESKLHFREPLESGSEATLSWGEDLVEFLPQASLAEQVDEVLVKGWDPEKKSAIVGQASSGQLYPEIGEARDGKSWAGAFGTGKVVIVDQPVVSQAEANQLAQARLNERSGAFIEAEGVAYRRPDVLAGQFVKIENAGRRFSGKYLVTRARHVFTPEGLETTFAVRGARTGLLAEQMLQTRPLDRWPGVVTAVVTDTNDPKDWGRVKVKFPWIANDVDSTWARLMGPGAGPECGFLNVPEVGDEVVVSFENGDFDRPVVMGGLWNGKDKIPPEVASGGQGERPLIREWRSRTGHYMVMHDDADKKIEIKTAGGHVITIDDQNKKVEIKTSGGHTITMDDQGKKLEVKSSGGAKMAMDDNARSVNVECGGNMTLKATGNIDIQATGMVNIKGATVNLN